MVQNGCIKSDGKEKDTDHCKRIGAQSSTIDSMLGLHSQLADSSEQRIQIINFQQ